MIIFKKSDPLFQLLQREKREGKKIGFVPTMGALHDGHLSLIQASTQDNDTTVCSIFVNPTQFNNKEDFNHYPVTIEKDIEMLVYNNCSFLFLPNEDEIYPQGYQKKTYNLGHLETILEGAFRPGHFQGVCQVVDQLLHIVHPDKLYLGAKDYQQCKVIQKLLEIIDMDNEVEIIISETVREQNGLAMSSRNMRLNETEKEKAPAIFEELQRIKEGIDRAPFEVLIQKAKTALEDKGFKIDYLVIADRDTLEEARDTSQPLIAIVAARIGDIRLIDNLTLN